MTVDRARRSMEILVELLIADDHELIRRRLISIRANSHPEWRVVADVPTLELVPSIRIIILSMHTAAPILHQVRKVGVSDYLAKNEAPKMLVHAVLHLLALGKKQQRVGFELDMSVRTAESHHANIMAKLNIQSSGDLVRIAFRDGVI